MSQFQHFVSRKQDGRVAKLVLIGSYVAKMSSDFYLRPPDIWRPVIGQFSSGHSQTIDTVHLKRFPSCINSTYIFKSPLSIYRLMGFTMQCLLCGRRSPSSGQFFLNLCRRIAPSVVNVFVRGMVLFILGAFFAMVLFMFSVLPEARRKRIQAVDLGIIANLFSAVWWIAPSSGTAAALVGIMYPCTDIRLGKPHKLEREWSSVFKCVVFFLGISHACAKISFNSPTNFSLFMAIASLVLWWLFDRSKNGLGLAVLVTFCACALLQSLIYLGVYRNGEPDFLYARTWIPWFFFSGVVTFGTIGRQLAMIEYNFGRSKEHVD